MENINLCSCSDYQHVALIYFSLRHKGKFKGHATTQNGKIIFGKISFHHFIKAKTTSSSLKVNKKYNEVLCVFTEVREMDVVSLKTAEM